MTQEKKIELNFNRPYILKIITRSWRKYTCKLYKFRGLFLLKIVNMMLERNKYEQKL